MAIRVRIPRPASGHHLRSRILLVLLAIVAAAAVTGVSIFGYFYHKYVGIVDERLKQPIFANTAQIYAAPREVRPGQKLSIRWIANELHDAGYTGDGATAIPAGKLQRRRAANYGRARPAVLSRAG